jgi:branched-chain amino acid transport system permease protein
MTNGRSRHIALVIAGALALLLLPLVAQYAGNFWVRILDIALLYVLLALGLNIVVGYAGLLDLGYVAFYAVGAYTFGLMASPQLIDSFPAIKSLFPGGLHVPVWGAIFIGAGVAAISSSRIAIQARPMRERSSR